jgi:phosphoglycerol transferase MdoB-like AlkP superfamily enzyme
MIEASTLLFFLFWLVFIVFFFFGAGDQIQYLAHANMCFIINILLALDIWYYKRMQY